MCGHLIKRTHLFDIAQIKFSLKYHKQRLHHFEMQQLSVIESLSWFPSGQKSWIVKITIFGGKMRVLAVWVGQKTT